jgi:hypothetical protein
MIRTARPGFAIVFAAAALVFVSPLAAATQKPPSSPSGRGEPAERVQAGSAPVRIIDNVDAQQTRGQLEDILERYPPTVGTVLKLDPSLLASQTYLAPYAALSAFLEQHPEVVHNPSFFFNNVRLNNWEPRDQRRQTIEMVGGVLAGIAGLVVFVVITMAIGWLIRTVINYRRWNRLSKVQTDVHTKLLDRFTANEDLLSYMETPAGKRFLESTPIPLDNESRSIGAPLSRILWSVQAGIVLAAGSIGVLYVSGRVVEEAGQLLFAVGIVGVALGAGFVLSALVSYVMSRRLGLIEQRPAEAPEPARQAGA